MKTGLPVMAAVALLSFAAGAPVSGSSIPGALAVSWQAAAARHNVADLRAVPAKRVASAKTRSFKWEKDLRGSHRYIVRFSDKPLASYRGDVPGLAATNPDTVQTTTVGRGTARSGNARLDTNSAASMAYLSYLDSQHARFEAGLTLTIGQPDVVYRYKHAFNGMTLRLTQAQAARVASMPGVAMVQRDYLRELHTADSVTLIGAPLLWDGSATGGIEARGEGMLIGVIDTGINTDHPSFAEISPGDGYVHLNPLGTGNYLRDCAPFDPVTNPNGGQSSLCNGKLIGTMALPGAADSVGQDDAEDWNGHGSHTAGTAGGNLILDVPYVDTNGNPTGIAFPLISGVAPRANVAAYLACGQGGCPGSDLVSAIDAATADGVDVINYSIGGGPSDPWIDSESLAFLGSRDAGIFVATSASNSGPGAGTVGSPAVSPWLTSVASSTHQRAFTEKMITDMSGGDTPPPGDIPGRSATPGYGPAAMVYAGDFGDPLCPLGAFPSNTFNGEIVLCDRGEFALVDKVESVASAGAGAVIIANTAASFTSLLDIAFGIPGIQINQANGDLLRAWLVSGTGHTGRITGSVPYLDDSLADRVAGSSGRGPNASVPDIISPSVAAPGINVYAPYYTPIEYATLTGTSMASPHVAGGAALISQVHPDWSAAEIHSALASTGERDMTRIEDAMPATPFDMGGGRIQLAEAVNAGLVMHETTDNFEAANPALGGDPTTLNLPSFANSECLVECTWQRTLRATTGGTWTASSDAATGMTIDVSPSVFTLAQGETIQITVSANVQSLPVDEWHFGWVHLTPDDLSVADQSFPLAVLPTPGDFPDSIDLNIRRDAGSILSGDFLTTELADLSLTAFGLATPTTTIVSVDGEAGEFSPFGETGVGIEFFTVSAGSILFTAATANSTAPDVDLFVGRDNNNDGQISEDELLCESGNPFDIESCELSGAVVSQGGSFWAAVVNFTGSGAGTDDTELTVVSVGPGDGSLTVEPPPTILPGEPWQIRIGWNTPGIAVGETRIGAIEFESGGSQIALVPVDLTRVEDDVRSSASTTNIVIGDIVDMMIEVEANLTPEDLSYTVDASIPGGFELVPGSIIASTGNVDFVDGVLTWALTNPSLLNVPDNYVPGINGPNVDTSNPLFDPTCDTGFGGYVDLESFGFDPNPAITGNSVSFLTLEGQDLPFYETDKTGFTITDDGFGVFDSGLGPTPWQNTGIPNAAEPNDLIALAWKDLEIVYDSASNSGVTITAPGPNLSVIEYDNMQPAPAGSTPDRIDFEVILNGAIDDGPGQFEIIAAYDNVAGDWSDATIGVENLNGTIGTQYNGPLSDGLMICYDYVGPDLSPSTLTYQLQAVAAGQFVHEIADVVDNPDSLEHQIQIVFEVGDGDGVDDSVDNCTQIANPDQRDTDADGIGNACDADVNNDCIVNFFDSFIYRDNFLLPGDRDTDNNGDNFTNFLDLMLLSDQFFGPPGPGATGTCTPP